MIRNLFHAAMGVAAIFAVGWLLAQPYVQKSMAHQKLAQYAAVGVLACLALFTMASLWFALKGRKSARGGFAYAPFGRRGR